MWPGVERDAVAPGLGVRPAGPTNGGAGRRQWDRRLPNSPADPLRREIGLVREKLRRVRAAGDAATAGHLEGELLDLVEKLNDWARS